MDTQKIIKTIFIGTAIFFVVVVCFWIFVIVTVTDAVQDNGGVKSSIVKVGKEMKDISNQIEENSSK